jgi:hypothetical protein
LHATEKSALNGYGKKTREDGRVMDRGRDRKIEIKEER